MNERFLFSAAYRHFYTSLLNQIYPDLTSKYISRGFQNYFTN